MCGISGRWKHSTKSLATLGCAFAHPTAVGRRLLWATPGKRPFRSFSVSGFLVQFVKTKKIKTGPLSCLYFLGSPSWTRRSRRPRPNQQPFRLLVATYRLVVTSEIQSPGCSRPTDKTNKKTDTRIMLYFWMLDSPSGPQRENSPLDCFLFPPFSRRSTRAPLSPTPS